MKSLIMGLVVVLGITGCVSKELTIATCDEYKDGMCINAKTEKLKECKEPLLQDGKTYCR